MPDVCDNIGYHKSRKTRNKGYAKYPILENKYRALSSLVYLITEPPTKFLPSTIQASPNLSPLSIDAAPSIPDPLWMAQSCLYYLN